VGKKGVFGKDAIATCKNFTVSLEKRRKKIATLLQRVGSTILLLFFKEWTPSKKLPLFSKEWAP